MRKKTIKEGEEAPGCFTETEQNDDETEPPMRRRKRKKKGVRKSGRSRERRVMMLGKNMGWKEDEKDVEMRTEGGER